MGKDKQEETEQVLRVAPFRADLVRVEQADQDMAAALSIINERHARKPLGAEDVFLFRAQVSNQELDSYFTRMAESSLRNYEQDARKSVPLMNSHRTGGFLTSAELPLGRSYDAKLMHDGEMLRLFVDHYILRGWQMNGVQSDELIRGIDGGVIRDMSIGFNPWVRGAWFRCSICGADMLRSDKCQHLPGLEYDGALASAWVEGARLVEDSMVYQGATPNAEIVRKAQRGLEEGWASDRQIRHLEEQYQVRIVGGPGVVSVLPEMAATGAAQSAEEPGPESEEVRDMDLERLQELFADVQGLAEVEETEAGLAVVRAKLDAVQGQVAELGQQLQAQEERVAVLEPQAAMGLRYVADLVDQAVAERVRAQGTTFDAEKYRGKLLADGDVDYIQAEIASWGEAARKQFTPGRQAGPQAEPTQTPMPEIPAAAYRV